MASLTRCPAEEAPVQALIYYYRELEKSKDLVLMRGEIFNHDIFSTHHLQMLVNFAQMFYTQDEVCIGSLAPAPTPIG